MYHSQQHQPIIISRGRIRSFEVKYTSEVLCFFLWFNIDSPARDTGCFALLWNTLNPRVNSQGDKILKIFEINIDNFFLLYLSSHSARNVPWIFRFFLLSVINHIKLERKIMKSYLSVSLSSAMMRDRHHIDTSRRIQLLLLRRFLTSSQSTYKRRGSSSKKTTHEKFKYSLIHHSLKSFW